MPMSAAMSVLDAPISEGGLGQFSPAVGWGIHSETGLATLEDLATLNVTTADPTRGYEVTEPQPTEAGVVASQVLAELNPTAAAGLIGIGAALPGLAGIPGTIASMMNPNPGLLDAITSQFDIETPSFLEPVEAALDTVSRGLDIATEAVTDVVGGVVTGAFSLANQALDATLGEALSAVETGFTDLGVSTGFFNPVTDPADIAETQAGIAEFDAAEASAGPQGGEPPALPTPAPAAAPPRDTRPAATVVSAVDTFLDTSATTSLVSIPDVTTPILGVDEDLGVAPMMSTIPRMGSFRRSRITSPRDRAFGAANLFRPTLSAGISL
jgi:hypothetical protein